MSFVPRLHALPGGVVTLADYEAHARTLLDAAAWAYLNADGLPASESVSAALREGGLPAFDYFLGGDE